MAARYRSVAIGIVEPIGNAFFLSRDIRLRDSYEARIAVLVDSINDLKAQRAVLQDRVDYYSGFYKEIHSTPEANDTSTIPIRPKYVSPANLRRHLEKLHRLPRKEDKDGTDN